MVYNSADTTPDHLPPTGSASPKLQITRAHEQHLRCFLLGMGPAITNVGHLEIHSGPMHSCALHAAATLLSLLAPACPALQQLTVRGDVGRPLFAALGVSCARLSSLEISEVSNSYLESLELMMPHLTHYKLSLSREPGKWWRYVSCASMTHLVLCESRLTAEVWRALPSGLTSLECCLEDNPLTGLTIVPSLQHLTLNCGQHSNIAELRSIIPVLHALPRLQQLHLRTGATGAAYMALNCAAARLPAVIYLLTRATAGLTMTMAGKGGEVSQGVYLSLTERGFEIQDAELDEDGGEDICSVADFVASLPPCPEVAGVWILETTFDSERSAMHIGSRFPRLSHLDMSRAAVLDQEDLVLLAACSSLQHLSLGKADVTVVDLAMLCSRLPLLKVLQLQECEGFYPTDDDQGGDEDDDNKTAALQGILRVWKCPVKVVALQDGW